MHHRMIVQPINIALRAVRVAPVRTLEEGPPFTPVPQIHRAGRRREHKRARIEHMRQRTRIILRVWRNFRESDVAGFLNELAKLSVGDGRPVHPKRGDGDAMSWCLLRIMLIRSHSERAAWNPQHVRMWPMKHQ